MARHQREISCGCGRRVLPRGDAIRALRAGISPIISHGAGYRAARCNNGASVAQNISSSRRRHGENHLA